MTKNGRHLTLLPRPKVVANFLRISKVLEYFCSSGGGEQILNAGSELLLEIEESTSGSNVVVKGSPLVLFRGTSDILATQVVEN